MPDTIIFDSHACVKRMTKAGVEPHVAEAFAAEQVNILEHHIATKKDIESLRKDIESLRKDIEGLRKDSEGLRKESEGLRKDSEGLRKDSEGLRKDTTALVLETKNDLIKWFVAALFLSAGLVVAGVGIVVQVLLNGISS